jgi:Zn-dependent protease
MTFVIHSVQIKISFWFVAVITLLMIAAPQSKVLICFLFCILHETGHLSAMFLFSERPLRIEFGYFGMKIVTGRQLFSIYKDIIVAAAGPLINLIFAAAFFFFGAYELMKINLALAIFNSLPIPALDGGRIIMLIFPNGRALKKIGIAAAAVLSVIGAAVAIYSRQNFIILIVSLYLLIGVITTEKP